MMFDLFFTFFKIGLFTFGGGYAMIPMIADEVVKKGWATQAMVIDFIAISESTPGPFAVNIATFIGYEMRGIPGALTTTLGIVMPSFLVILIIARFFASFSDNRFVKYALAGLRPVVVGLIIAATYTIVVAAFYVENAAVPFVERIEWRSVGIFAVCFLLSRKISAHPVVWILLSAALGIVLYGFF